MAVSRRSRFPLRTVQRHRSSWTFGAATAGDGAPQALSGSAGQLGGTQIQSLSDSQTIIRTRGELTIWLLSAAAAGDGFHGAFGLAKANTEAVIAGEPSLPTPIAQETWDGWFYHRYFSLFSGGPIAAATAAQEALQINNVMAAVRIEVDSKAMRKIDINESIYAMIEVAEHGTATMEWAFNSRTLFKLMA